MNNTLKTLFGIDLRSLALFRICLGLIILADLATRASDLTIFYTDVGALPRAALMGSRYSAFLLSIHLINGTVLAQALLFLLHGACAIGLLLGWRTRAMTVLTWLLTVSVRHRWASPRCRKA